MSLLATVVVGFSLALLVVSRADQEDVVATVNGAPITSLEFDAYAAVFADGGGARTVTREQVLLSLIHQELVSQEASRRDIAIAASALDAATTETDALDLRDSIDRNRGRDAFRQRLEAFLLMKAVKHAVIKTVEIAESEIVTAYESDLSLSVLSLAEARPVLVAELQESATQELWETWLREQRECSAVIINDPTIAIASTTPLPACRNR